MRVSVWCLKDVAVKIQTNDFITAVLADTSCFNTNSHADPSDILIRIRLIMGPYVNAVFTKYVFEVIAKAKVM